MSAFALPLGATNADTAAAWIRDAFSVAGVTERDLGFKKDVFPDANLSPLVKNLLARPLRTFEVAEALEKEWTLPPWEKRKIVSPDGTSFSSGEWASVPERLRPILGKLTSRLAFHKRRTDAIFSKIPESLWKKALSAYAVDTFHLEKDPEARRFWGSECGGAGWISNDLEKYKNFTLGETELIRPRLEAGFRIDPVWLEKEMRDLMTQIRDFTVEAKPLIREHPEDFRFGKIRFHCELGNVILGGTGRDRYTRAETEDASLLVDFGGDDVYEEAGVSHPGKNTFAIAVDFSGNDHYGAAGSGVFGVGLLWDESGDDVYAGKNATFGAGLFGAGVLVDLSGRDRYTSDTLSQGAAAFGFGLLWDGAGDDVYRAALCGQGFAGVNGLGVLLDVSGSDHYEAGKKYVDYDHYPDHFLSMSQGFAMGYRPFAPGGVGLLIDHSGDDSYEADVYGQGTSYWYSLGGLIDGGGNDRYHACEYAQGSGIHLSVGFLKDKSGDDFYSADKGLAQGASHDFAVGLLWEGGGHDVYEAESGSQGSALNNATAFFLKESGSGEYRLRQKGDALGQGYGGYSPRRGMGSLGILLDLSRNVRFSNPIGADVFENGRLGLRLRVKGPDQLTNIKKEWDTRSLIARVQEFFLGSAFWISKWSGRSDALFSRSDFRFGRMASAAPSYEPASFEEIAASGGDEKLGLVLMKTALYGDTPQKVEMRERALVELKALLLSKLPALLPWARLADLSIFTEISEQIRKRGKETLPLLRSNAMSPFREIRSLCLYHLGELGDSNDVPLVLATLADEKEPRLRPGALLTLSKLGASGNEEKIFPFLRSKRELERTLAVRILAKSLVSNVVASERPVFSARTWLPKMFEDPDQNVRLEAVSAFQKICGSNIATEMRLELKKNHSELGRFWLLKVTNR